MILSFFKWPPKRFADNPRSKQASNSYYTHVGVQWTERMSNSPSSSLESSNFGLLQSKFFSLLTAIKRPCCNLQKDLITVLKLKAFLPPKIGIDLKVKKVFISIVQ